MHPFACCPHQMISEWSLNFTFSDGLWVIWKIFDLSLSFYLYMFECGLAVFFRAVVGKHSFPEQLMKHSRMILSFRSCHRLYPAHLRTQREPEGSCCRSPLEERAKRAVTMSWLSFDGEINSFHNHIILVALCPAFTQTWKKWKLIEKEKKCFSLSPLQASLIWRSDEKEIQVFFGSGSQDVYFLLQFWI